MYGTLRLERRLAVHAPVRPGTGAAGVRTGTGTGAHPHTVRVLPYNYCNENEYQCLCGYRREFFAPREWAGRTVLLTFGAVAHDATVFCNGRRLFHHACGYTAFTVDLTSALHLGQKTWWLCAATAARI